MYDDREDKERLRIPYDNPDLIRYALLAHAKRLLGFLTWSGVWSVGLWRYFSERRLSSWLKLALLIAGVLLLGFILFEMKKYFFDRTVRGKVVDIKVRRTYGRVRNAAGKKVPRYYNNIVLKLETGAGKRRRLVFPQKDGLVYAYKLGRELTHYRGLVYPVARLEEDNARKICSVCGKVMKEEEMRCRACEHTLIQPERASEFAWWYQA